MFDLNGKVAVITGAAGILGRKFCQGLAEYGADLALIDLNQSDIDDLSEQLSKSYNINAKGYQCDVSDQDSVIKMVKDVKKDFKKINILLNNAASKSDDLEKFFTPYENYTIDEWQKIMSVNIDGMFLVSKEIGKQMLKQKTGGSIIQTSSIYGEMAPDNSIYKNSFYLGHKINTPAVYASSKAAVNGLTKYLASYWGDKSIRVNSISPGGVESGQNSEFIKRYSSRIPMKRMAKDYEMVGTVIYLASDASSYVTGQNIFIDGGLNCL